MGNKHASQVQIGQEVTAGTAVTPTARWRGEASMPDDQEVLVFPEEDVGSIPGKDRSYIPALLTEMSFLDTPATFEQVPYPLISGVLDDDPVADGTGTGWITQHDFPTSTVPTVTDLKTLSITGGDDKDQEQVEYFFTEEFTLGGIAEESLMLSGWKGKGRQSTLDDFETLTLPTVEEIKVNLASLYIDAVAGTVGTTLITDVIREISLKIKTGWIHRWGADGQLYFNKCVMTRPELTLEITFDHDTVAMAQKVAKRAQTPKLIQVNFKGSELTTADTYTYKRHIWNLAGKWEKFDPLGNDGGVTVSKGIFKVRENDVASLYAEITNVNEQETLP